MTRKHFELIAATLRRTRPNPSAAVAYSLWRGIVREFAESLKLENNRFNLDRFERAAGVESIT